jgi:hypothetical protein
MIESLQLKTHRKRHGLSVAVGPSTSINIWQSVVCDVVLILANGSGTGQPTPYLDTFFPLESGREWFTPKELAALLGRTDQFVRDMLENDRILGHALRGRGQSDRRSYQIHRNAVELYLLETANFTPEDYVERLFRLIRRLPRPFRERMREML